MAPYGITSDRRKANPADHYGIAEMSPRPLITVFYPFSTESDTGVLDETEPEIGYGVRVEVTSESGGRPCLCAAFYRSS